MLELAKTNNPTEINDETAILAELADPILRHRFARRRGKFTSSRDVTPTREASMTITTSMSRTRPLIGIAIAIAGISLMSWGFVAGIDAALDASGSGPGFFVAVFFAGAALVITTAVLAVIGLSRGEHRGLWIGSLALSALPAVAILVLVVQARS